MDFGWDSYHKFPAVVFTCYWFRYWFSIFFHVVNYLCDNIPNTLKSSFRCLGQPAKALELSAKANIFLVFF